MNIDKVLKAKKQLKISYEKGFISKKKFKKELDWINQYYPINDQCISSKDKSVLQRS